MTTSAYIFNFRVSPWFTTWVLISTISLCACTHHTTNPLMHTPTLHPLRYHQPIHALTPPPHRCCYLLSTHKYYPLNPQITLYHYNYLIHHQQWPPPGAPHTAAPHTIQAPSSPTHPKPTHTEVSKTSCTYHTTNTPTKQSIKSKKTLSTNLPAKSHYHRRRYPALPLAHKLEYAKPHQEQSKQHRKPSLPRIPPLTPMCKPPLRSLLPQRNAVHPTHRHTTYHPDSPWPPTAKPLHPLKSATTTLNHPQTPQKPLTSPRRKNQWNPDTRQHQTAALTIHILGTNRLSHMISTPQCVHKPSLDAHRPLHPYHTDTQPQPIGSHA